MKLIFVIVVVFLTKTCSSQTLCESLEAQAVNDVTPECMDQLLIMCNNGSLWWRSKYHLFLKVPVHIFLYQWWTLPPSTPSLECHTAATKISEITTNA